MTVDNIGYAALESEKLLEPWRYQIRDSKANDVLIEVAYCGICHSDIHATRGEWKGTIFPMVPGHEFTGTVVKVGDGVTKHKIGDRVAVGCMVGSCRDCENCKEGLQQYCPKREPTYRYKYPDGEITYGGYGRYVVAAEDFVLKVPENLPMDRAAPLLCAGITTYSPLVHLGLKSGGRKVGVIGLGGLGHMAVQFAAAFGNEVVALSRTEGKRELAKSLGATHFLVTDEDYKTHSQTLDVIMDTVSAQKPMDKYVNLLKRDGILMIAGLPPAGEENTLPVFPLIMKRRSLMGSVIGGIPETQEMLDYCSEKMILPVIETITCEKINEAYDRVVKGDVQFRFVIDVKGGHPAL